MSDDLESLKKQLDIALEAYVATFSKPFFVESAVQHAAFQIEEMRGGRTMADREAERKAERKATEDEREARYAQQAQDELNEAAELLRQNGYAVEPPDPEYWSRRQALKEGRSDIE